MKLNLKTTTLMIGLMAMSLSTTAYSKTMGGDSGGGGDASESRVDDIREDILTWINAGGARGLKLPAEMKYEDYVSKMSNILQPQNVVVTFIEKDDSTNEELQVSVDGKPKTCRGFYSKLDKTPHILCNISRFAATADAKQYKLIHHEFAGLVNVEKNDKAASDYSLSSQITEYLSLQSVLKLAVKKGNAKDRACKIYSKDILEMKSSKINIENIEKATYIEKLLKKKNYTFVDSEDSASIVVEKVNLFCDDGTDFWGNRYCSVPGYNFEITDVDTGETRRISKAVDDIDPNLKESIELLPKCIK
jgi:hypothetical protein